jgi:1-deoxy-D-xylulose-5-phosphate reductoisomerase
MSYLRKVTVFGSTGSIGQNTVNLLDSNKELFEVVGLTGGRNLTKLAEQARLLNPEIVATAFEDEYLRLKELLSDTNIRVVAGVQGLREVSDIPADVFVSAIIGFEGLESSLRSLKHGGVLALANKESLVAAGPLLMSQAKVFGSKIIPVDSEHSGIFQILEGKDVLNVEKIIITASGGPFRGWSYEDLRFVTPEQASKHPTWDMGLRISIDSASMFNKAMELIETKEYFNVSADKLEVLIHPESRIHSFVGFNDGSLIAHMSDNDMRHCIGFALAWPRHFLSPVNRIDLSEIGALNFEKVSGELSAALLIAREVMNYGGLMGAAFNASKEIALDRFISGEIGFLDMSSVVSGTLSALEGKGSVLKMEHVLENIIEVNRVSREISNNFVIKK